MSRPGSWTARGLVSSGCIFACICLAASFARADVTGTVTLVGKQGSEDQTFVAQANNCGESPIRKTENWKVGPKGELGDVVVWIVDPKPPPSPTTPTTVSPVLLPSPEVEVRQLGCRYIPHVIAVQAVANFKIINADPTLHNIRARISNGASQPPGDTVFNFGQATQGQTDEREFDNPGLYTLQCDVHAWMQCWVMVLKSDCFDVTGTDGAFKLRNSSMGALADGDYKIDAWHPRFSDTMEQTIHVKNGSATINFQFDGTKSF